MKVARASEANPLKLLTWSWTANESAKIVFPMQYGNRAVRYMHKSLELTSSGLLRLVGHAIGLP